MNYVKFLMMITVSAVIGISATANAAVLVANWNLDEGSGTVINESVSDTDSTAGFPTGVSWSGDSGPSVVSNSLLFSGTNAINTLDTGVSGSILDGTDVKTFVAWINHVSGETTILSYSPKGGLVSGADLRLRINADGQLRGEVSGGFLVYDGKDFRNDGWNMVAIIFDGNTNASSFYIAGTGLVAPSSSSNQTINTNSSGTPGADSFPNFVIGGDQAGRSYNGNIAQVQVYTGTMTEAELDAIYNLSIIPEPATAGLLGLAALAMLRRKRVTVA